jgi:hypothetical protein
VLFRSGGPDPGALATMGVPALRLAAAERPGSYPVQMALANALAGSGQTQEAMQAFERAAALLPAAIGPESPHARMAGIALERKDRARAMTELQALVAADFNNIDAARRLAGLFHDAGIDDPARLAVGGGELEGRLTILRIAGETPLEGDDRLLQLRVRHPGLPFRSTRVLKRTLRA